MAVDRGFVTAESGAVVPSYAAPPSGEVTITARLRVDETDPDHRPAFTADGHRQLYVTDSRTLAATTGLPIAEGYLSLAADQPGVLDPLPVEPAAAQSAAPFTNFSYALQWLTFGAIAVFALVYFVRLEMLQRQSAAGTTRKTSARRADRAAFRRELAGEDDPPSGQLSLPPRVRAAPPHVREPASILAAAPSVAPRPSRPQPVAARNPRGPRSSRLRDPRGHRAPSRPQSRQRREPSGVTVARKQGLGRAAGQRPSRRNPRGPRQFPGPSASPPRPHRRAARQAAGQHRRRHPDQP